MKVGDLAVDTTVGQHVLIVEWIRKRGNKDFTNVWRVLYEDGGLGIASDDELDIIQND